MTGRRRRGALPVLGVQREYEDAMGGRRVIAEDDLRAVEATMLPEEPDA